MKMNELEDFKTMEETPQRKLEKQRNDLVSKKLGELLLQGFKMLNETCDQCECILMQKKNSPVYCVGCEDRDVLALMSKSTVKQSQPEKEEPMQFAPSSIVSNAQPAKKSEIKSNDRVQNSYVNTSFTHTIETLRSKINWATEELRLSTNVRYNIELCEMIKMASEAMKSLNQSAEA